MCAHNLLLLLNLNNCCYLIMVHNTILFKSLVV